MIVADRVFVVAPLLFGRPQVGGVAIAEVKPTAVVTSAVANAERSAESTAVLTPQNFVKTIKKQGIGVKVNPRNAATAQEGNVTLSLGADVSVNIRIETHPLKPKGPPVRHANVDVIRRVRGKKKVVSKTHIVE